MSKMSEMAATIDDLRSAAAAISNATDWLAVQFGGSEAQEASPSQTMPEVRQPTLEDVRSVLARKSLEGHTAAIQALIKKYGADKLSQVESAHYKALLADAEGL